MDSAQGEQGEWTLLEGVAGLPLGVYEALVDRLEAPIEHEAVKKCSRREMRIDVRLQWKTPTTILCEWDVVQSPFSH